MFAARARRVRVRDRRVAVRSAPRASRVRGLGPALGVRARRPAHGRVCRARDRVPAQRLCLQHGRKHLEPHHARVLPGRRRVVLAGRLAAVVGLAAVPVVEPRPVHHAQAHARRRRLRDRDPARLRRLLHQPDDLLRGPVRGDPPGARRRPRARSAAALPHDDDPPAGAVLRLHPVHDPARLRHGRPARAAARRRLAQSDPPLRLRRVAVPRRRHPARGSLVLLGARLGRLLGVGRGRERLVDAVADGHRVPALADDPGEARHAEGVERVARARHRHPRDHGHVPRTQRDPQLDPRLRRCDARRALRGPHRSADRRLDLSRAEPPRDAAIAEPARFAALARVDLPRQQPRARGALLRDLLGHLLPPDLRRPHRPRSIRRVRPGSTATRCRSRSCWCS